MDESDLLGVFAGLVAYSLAVLLGAGPVIYAAYWVDKQLTTKIDEDKELKADNRAIAIELGTTMFCQAVLIRHAVYAVMAVVRSLFIEQFAWKGVALIGVRSILCALVIVVLSLISIHVAGYVFKKLVRHINIEHAIRTGNVAMAIFYALALLAITLVLNEGMEDFSRSLIPYGRAGIVDLP